MPLEPSLQSARPRRLRVAAVATLMLLVAMRLGAQQQPPIALAPAIRGITADLSDAQIAPYLPAIIRFYDARQRQPVWTRAAGDGLAPAGERLIATLARAPGHGLVGSDYLPPVVDTLLAAHDSVSTARLEVMLSLGLLRFVHDLGWGVVPPNASDRGGNPPQAPFRPDSILAGIARADDPGAAVMAHEPGSPAYRYLQRALAILRAEEARGGWHRATAGATLRPGDHGARVGELRLLLVERGDLAPALARGDSFDLDVAAALVRFQRRHGLAADTAFGPGSRAEMNVPLADRIRQVSLGMERLRWLPRLTGHRSVGVNLAAFRAYIIDDGQVTLDMDVVIGKRYHETPIFTDTMTYVVLNPAWTIPTSIVNEEILPELAKDSLYLEKNHMVRKGTMLEQVPGPWNALGRFKFMLPNSYDVYLHDTPIKSLFARRDRAFSHGCVRLRDADQFALAILSPQGWTRARIDSVLATGEQTVVPLEQPVPVRITYATAFTDPDGVLQFRRDVYGRDRELLATIERMRHAPWRP